METTVQGTATVQGRLWGARARDWAELGEPATRDLYPPVLDAAGVGTGTRLLDVGCGTGVAAGEASRRGARVSGLDAAAAFVELARERVPAGDFVVGEMEALRMRTGPSTSSRASTPSSTRPAPATRCARRGAWAARSWPSRGARRSSARRLRS